MTVAWIQKRFLISFHRLFEFFIYLLISYIFRDYNNYQDKYIITQRNTKIKIVYKYNSIRYEYVDDYVKHGEGTRG